MIKLGEQYKPHRQPIQWRCVRRNLDGGLEVIGECNGRGEAFAMPFSATSALGWLAVMTVTHRLLFVLGTGEVQPLGLMRGAYQ